MLRAILPCALVLFVTRALIAAPAPDTAALSVNNLGLELLRQQPAGQNAVLSPYSVDLALTMTWEGARGDTRTQMARVLGYPAATKSVPLATLCKDLAAISARNGNDSLSERVDIACRLFGQKSFSFDPVYLDLVRKNYGAPLEPVDFGKNGAAAAKTINAWVEKQTRNRIRDLVSPAALTPDTRLVLVNAIYFKAAWENTFEKASTKPVPFHFADGKVVAVPTMSQSTEIGYRKGKGYTAVSLPYATGEFSFLIVMPDALDGLPAVEHSLDAATLAGFARLDKHSGAIHIPKFKFEPPAASLAEALRKLGMASAFNIPPGSADFTGIAPARGDERLYLSDVIHKAFVSIDERGTEAAATAVVMLAFSAPDMRKPVEVRVDRPFLFAVQHIRSGACLFLGRVTDPR
jgi:serpin B